jgi:penicillin-binding protein 2
VSDYFFNRSTIIKIVFISLACILGFRLFKLQIVDDFEAQAAGQSILRQVIYPDRGALIDRKGKSILQNSFNYNLYCIPKLIKNLDTFSLCKILDITDSTFKETIRRARLKDPNANHSILLLKDLSAERVAALNELIYDYAGFELKEHTVRYSPYECGGLVIGYTGEISQNMLNQARYESYQKGDYVGISGLEASYEEILRGQRGVKYAIRDNLNRVKGTYKNGKLDTIAIKGKDLELYLDIELQQYAEKLLANKLGSLVAIDPKTGGILAMVSSPSFDPNIVNKSNRNQLMYKLLTDPTKPLFNRAVQATYPPGSTFKPITALVALDEGVISPSFGLGCGGSYHICGGNIGCTHSGGGHAANLRNAMANSCNSYFCHLFRLAVDNPTIGNHQKGLDKWREYMLNFSYGRKTGIDLPVENTGNIPNSKYFDKVYKNNWNTCQNCMIGMGQGEVLVTPLQMANSMAIIANKGYYYEPHFVKSIGKDTAHPNLKRYLVKHEPVHIADSAFEAVHDGMEYVVIQGTGTVAKIPGVRICAKTGTVENYGPLVINGKPVKNKNHSMFVAFAPRDNPKIAIAVAVENAGYGATWAGPIASLIMEKYLTDSVNKKRKALETKMYKSNVIPRNIYIVDSLQRQKDKDRELRKQFVKDSIARFKIIKDSISKVKKLQAPAIKSPSPKPTPPQKPKTLKDKLFGLAATHRYEQLT